MNKVISGKKNNIIINYVENNLKQYIVVTLIFIIGIFMGVLFVNEATDEQKSEINSYINNYIDNIKAQNKDGNIANFKSNVRDNIILAIILWFAGTTIIGILIVFGMVIFRGFCLGYTISACSATIGVTKGIVFTFVSILLQNILFIPAILTLGVSSIKLYQSIMKDKRKENIKLEIIRHTIISVIMLLVLILSAFVEYWGSYKLLLATIKYF